MSFLRSEPGEEPVLVEGLLPASPERVFRAWTEPAELARWFGLKENGLLSAKVDLRVGGAWRFEMRAEGEDRHFLEGDYLELAPPHRLSFTWRHVIEPPGGAPQPSPVSRVSVTFEPQGAATLIRLRHEAIERLPARVSVGSGWTAGLERLARILGEDQ